jgi:integrase
LGVATIRERKPGVWEIRAFTGRGADGSPTQVSRTVRGTKKDALRVVAELTIAPAGRAAGRSVSDVLEAWVRKHDATWAPASRRDQLSRVARINADRIARVSVARLTIEDVERWHARLRDSGLADVSIRNLHGVLRAALTQAVRWGWVTRNVASLAELSSRKIAPRGVMSASDVRRVIAVGDEIGADVGLMLRLAAVTGARRSELAALQWTDVADGVLTVDSAIETDRRSGRTVLSDAPTKTANQRRLTLDAATLAVVAAQQAELEPYGPWMFNVGDEPPNPDRIGYWWRIARDKAGLDAKWRLHDLRHWSASVAIAAGHDVKTVADRLGHANAAMTLRVYAHEFAKSDRAVADSVGAALEGDA